MTAAELTALLVRLGACDEARRWAEGKTLAEAWAKCERADWMLWLGVRLNREACRPALYAVADRAVRVYAPRTFDRVAKRYADETARQLREWAETLRALPEIVDEETARYAEGWSRAADAAADAAAAAAYAADAAYAAYAAADAAAAYAAYAAAADAADADAADAAEWQRLRAEAMRELADLVRERLPLSALAVRP